MTTKNPKATITFGRTGKKIRFGQVQIGGLLWAHDQFWIRYDTESAKAIDPAIGNNGHTSCCNFIIDGKAINYQNTDPKKSLDYGEWVEEVEITATSI